MVWFTILELHTDMLFQIEVQLLSHPSCIGFTGISKKIKMGHVFPLPQIVITMLYLGK